MIDWKALENNPDVDDEVIRKVKICENCNFIGKNNNCTISHCKCFVTSMAIRKDECPLGKWSILQSKQNSGKI